MNSLWKIHDIIMWGIAVVIIIGLGVGGVYCLLEGFWKGVFGALFWMALLTSLLFWHFKVKRKGKEKQKAEEANPS